MLRKLFVFSSFAAENFFGKFFCFGMKLGNCIAEINFNRFRGRTAEIARATLEHCLQSLSTNRWPCFYELGTKQVEVTEDRLGSFCSSTLNLSSSLDDVAMNFKYKYLGQWWWLSW